MKKLAAAAAALLFGAGAFAYNPPAGGQNILKITSPELLTGANSTAGGPLFITTPDSVVNNPAITGFNQRNTLDLAGTLLFDSEDDEHSLGGACSIGLSMATRGCVPTFLVQGIFVPYERMQLGNSINFTAGYARDITDELAIGASANIGLFYGYGTDWTASASLGALYRLGDVSFLRDVRFGFALANLGKMYTETEVLGIADIGDFSGEKLSDAEKSKNGMWPGIATPRFGVAAKLLDHEKFKLGLSLDLSAPGFQDFVGDVGLQIDALNFVRLSSSWEYDLREFSNDCKNILPSVGLSFHFMIKAKGAYLSKNGWEQSEMTAGAAWKRLYEDVDAVSAGVVVDLGLNDEEAPEIIMWGDE